MIDVENVTRLDDDDLRAILKWVATDTLLAVLSAASPIARNRVLAVLPNRAAAMVQDDLDDLPAVTIADLTIATATFARQITEAVAAGDLPHRVLEQLA